MMEIQITMEARDFQKFPSFLPASSDDTFHLLHNNPKNVAEEQANEQEWNCFQQVAHAFSFAVSSLGGGSSSLFRFERLLKLFKAANKPPRPTAGRVQYSGGTVPFRMRIITVAIPHTPMYTHATTVRNIWYLSLPRSYLVVLCRVRGLDKRILS